MTRHTLRKDHTDIARQAIFWNVQGNRTRGQRRITWRTTVEREAEQQNKKLQEIAALAENRNNIWSVHIELIRMNIFMLLFMLTLIAIVQSVTINTSPLDVTCNITKINLDYVDNVNVCHVTSSLNITNPNESVNLVNSGNTKIDGVVIHNKEVHWLPQFDDSVASNLRVLVVERSHLKGLTQNCLKMMTNLESLDLNSNDIEELKNKPFEFNKKLTFINFLRNKIKFVEVGTFDSLENLNRLYFRNNKCISSGGNAKNKEKVRKLLIIIYDSCKALNEGKDIKRLVLYIYFKISVKVLIENNKDLKNYYRIIVLIYAVKGHTFSDVALNAVDWKPLDVLCNVTKINLDKVDDVTVCHVTSSLNITNPYESVNLVHSGHTQIDGFLVRKKSVLWLPQFDDTTALNLRILTVEDSKLKEITQNCLKLLIDLESLDLNSNNIQELKNQPFECNKKLTFINLTNNKIKFIEPGTFDDLQHLNGLYLHKNDCFTKGANAKTRDNVKRLLIMLQTVCKASNEKPKTTTSKKRRSTTKEYSRHTTSTEQNINNLNISTSTSEPFQIDSTSHSYKIAILSAILLTLIVTIACAVRHNSSAPKNTESQSSNGNSEELSKRTKNSHAVLTSINPDHNIIEIPQRTSDIYEDILEYQRSIDETYQNPLDDEIADEILKSNFNHDDFYEEIMIDAAKFSDDLMNGELQDQLYNGSDDFYSQTVDELIPNICENEESNQTYANQYDFDQNQQNVLTDSIEVDQTQDNSEDIYAETYINVPQEPVNDIYATVQKN
ncbi:unnamed protein product [Chironomus riparius]|uniref:Uncharacterized protein n=1 Tax=Chironomus riparius TaxID=315576 RepID=A0A9N9S8G4_9DIPT|nr:unnamed protein product [Chironomus riparius]